MFICDNRVYQNQSIHAAYAYNLLLGDHEESQESIDLELSCAKAQDNGWVSSD